MDFSTLQQLAYLQGDAPRDRPRTVCRALFITDAIAQGMPPHIVQLVAGHRDINTTMGYTAVYPEEVINGHRAFIARRRAAPQRGIPHHHRPRMGRVRRALHIVAHREAGLRSFDMTMPEEVNRRLVDQLSDLCLVTSPDAVGHLANEGVAVDRIHFVGDPMIDTLLKNLPKFDTEAVRRSFGLPERYVLATMHRPANVDDPATAVALVTRLHEIASLTEVVIPLHPRGRSVLLAAGLDDHPSVHVLDPLGYIDFLAVVRGAAAVVTDSGGLQEETTMLGVPCLTVRPNTERPITITHGTNRLVTLDELVPAARKALETTVTTQRTPPLWDGQAGPRIAEVIIGVLS